MSVSIETNQQHHAQIRCNFVITSATLPTNQPAFDDIMCRRDGGSGGDIVPPGQMTHTHVSHSCWYVCVCVRISQNATRRARNHASLAHCGGATSVRALAHMR